MGTTSGIRVVRYDQDKENPTTHTIDQDQDAETETVDKITREFIISKYQIPEDSILKIYSDGKMIPWSFLPRCDLETVEFQVYRPHQNIKPKLQNADKSAADVIIREKVKQLEFRVASLEEAVADPENIISTKTDKDLQALTKQIAFVSKRFGEAEQAEWVKRPEPVT